MIEFPEFAEKYPQWRERIAGILDPAPAEILISLIEWDAEPRCNKEPIEGEQWVSIQEFLMITDDWRPCLTDIHDLSQMDLIRRAFVDDWLPFLRPNYEQVSVMLESLGK